MKRRRKRTKVYSTIVFILLISIGIGYSIINSSVGINGTSTIAKVIWDVHFENISVLKGSNLLSSDMTLSNSDTQINTNIVFTTPGEILRFNVDVVNDGTMDAMLDEISFSDLTTEQQKLISYSVTYSDGTPMQQYDLLEKNKDEQLLIEISYGVGLTSSDYPDEDQTINLALNIKYVQNDEEASQERTLYSVMQRNAVLDNIASKYVTSETGINFSAVGSSTNGMGVYIKNGTENNNYPIYYFRGPISSNNVIFANFCWKMVRSTDTGGVKLIYNGLPVDGQCTNTGESTFATKSAFNTYTTNHSMADIGYMYGTRIESAILAMTGKTYVYGNDVTYSNGTYTLTDTYTPTLGWGTTYSTIRSKYHYTCMSTSTTCSSVYYIYNVGSINAHHIILTGGTKIENAITSMTTSSTNITSSTIKTVVDNWYKTNLLSYESKIEDTVYCNDRTIYDYAGWDRNTSSTADMHFNGYDRNFLTYTPTTACSNAADKFTVSSTIGNGNLTYPVGLITADEVILASGGANQYLDPGKAYWTMTPSYIGDNTSGPHNFVHNAILESLSAITSEYGVRPVISVKNNVLIESGKGTQENPYVIE